MVIYEQHRNAVVALNDAEEEIHIGIHPRGVHGGKLLGGIGPNLHTLALLHCHIIYEIV